MRIDHLRIENFKKYQEQDLDLHSQFTLLVGENGSGKTTVLDALAVAAGIWLVEPPDSILSNSGRIIYSYEIRTEGEKNGDRIQFHERTPVKIQATGKIGDTEDVSWTRQIRPGGKRTSNADAKQALAIIKDIYQRAGAEQEVLCPVVAYYGAGRAWLPSHERIPGESKPDVAARRWAAFYDCFNERIRFSELRKWFHRETTAAGNRGGRMRPGFEVVKKAILQCVPNADGIWFDPDLVQIVISIGGNAQPFDNLSAGQQMMLALVADLAIKAITQNAYLLPADVLGEEDQPLPRVLRETPGVVLIDELDVHLHPKWQRQVIDDLRKTFPSLQFIATTHSPFIIQALGNGKLIQLGQGDDHVDPTGETIEDIAESIQGIEMPQHSKRAERLNAATDRYFHLLRSGAGVAPDDLDSAEKEFREASEGFSTQPGLEALLKLEALAAKHNVK